MKTLALFKTFFFTILIISCTSDDSSTIVQEDTEQISQILINSYTPNQGFPNDVITINGENFNTLISNNTLLFNNVIANITSITTTQIKAEIPNEPAGNYNISLNVNDEIFTIGNFEILDNSKILVYSPLGQIHEVYTGSGECNLINTINYDFWSQGNLNVIDFSEDILYIADFSSSEFRILQYNLSTNTLETTSNTFSNIPELTSTNFPAITAINFNISDGLLYLLFAGDDQTNESFPYYLYTFNPQTEEFLNANLSFNLDIIRSAYISNNTWYLSSNNGLIINIDLQSSTTSSQLINKPLHKTFKYNNLLYGIYKNPSQIEATLTSLETSSGNLTDISNNTLGFLNPSGSGFINTQNEFIDFTIVSNNNNGFTNNGLYKYNLQDNTLYKVYLENQDLGYGTKILKELN